MAKVDVVWSGLAIYASTVVLNGGSGGGYPKSGPKLNFNGPNGQTATYRKTEGNQSYLRIWGTYDPIESRPSDPKNGGYIGVA